MKFCNNSGLIPRKCSTINKLLNKSVSCTGIWFYLPLNNRAMKRKGIPYTFIVLNVIWSFPNRWPTRFFTWILIFAALPACWAVWGPSALLFSMWTPIFLPTQFLLFTQLTRNKISVDFDFFYSQFLCLVSPINLLSDLFLPWYKGKLDRQGLGPWGIKPGTQPGGVTKAPHLGGEERVHERHKL